MQALSHWGLYDQRHMLLEPLAPANLRQELSLHVIDCPGHMARVVGAPDVGPRLSAPAHGQQVIHGILRKYLMLMTWSS